MKREWLYAMAILAATLVVAFAPLPAGHEQPSARTIRVDAAQFAYSPSVLSVNAGDTVTIELTSSDVAHGLYIDGYGVSVQSDPGQTASMTFVANRPGSFRIRCNVTCGAMHPFMIGKLKVGGDTALLRATALGLVGLLGIALFRPRPQAGVA